MIIESIREVIQGLKTLKAADIRPKIPILLQKGQYVVKTVDRPDEFSEVLRLRYDVFHREFRGAQMPVGWDIDDYDSIADHLIIVRTGEQGAAQIVGTYRMICSSFSSKFYSQTEFELSKFLQEPGIKLELGRACIHPDHRKGSVMNLLWRGVSEYLRLSGAKYLFGCSSVKLIDTPEVEGIYRYLQLRGSLVEAFGIQPLASFECPGLRERISAAAPVAEGAPMDPALEAQAKPLVPPLLEMYLLAGAKVMGRPALDRDFACVDFLTVLDTAHLSPLFSRRYAGGQA